MGASCRSGNSLEENVAAALAEVAVVVAAAAGGGGATDARGGSIGCD